MAFNLVEIAASVEGDNECAFDQRCKFGHRVESHAVYCHNDNWDDSPRKCRRSWYTNGKVKDEDCAGFEPNPKFTGQLAPTPLVGDVCTKCSGKKRIDADRGKTETCPLCVGSGAEPHSIPLSTYEQDTLESGTTHSGRHDTAGHSFVRIAESPEENDSVHKLCEMDLIVLRSMSFMEGGTAYLLENTMKGEAVMRQNWAMCRALLK